MTQDPPAPDVPTETSRVVSVWLVAFALACVPAVIVGFWSLRLWRGFARDESRFGLIVFKNRRQN